MSDQALSSLSEEVLEQMVASEGGISHLDLYNELADRYLKKNELDKAALALERLISEYDGKIETGTLVNARYKQALMYWRAEDHEIAYTYAAKGLTQWEADHDAEYFFLELAKCFIVELRSGMELGFISDIPEKAEFLLEISRKLELKNYIQMTYMIIAEAYFHLEQDDKCEEYFKLAEDSDEVSESTRERIDYYRNEMNAPK